MTVDDLAAVHSALVETSRRLSAAGERVEYVRSIYLSSLERWIAVFAAEAPEGVRHAVKIAQLPRAEVNEAIELAVPDGVHHMDSDPGGEAQWTSR